MHGKCGGIALLLAAAPVVSGGCSSKAKSCNEFFDVASPIMSAVAVPSGAPSGSAAVAWARDTATQYERLAKEAGRIAERERHEGLQRALEDEQRSAALVAKQLDALAEVATSGEPAKIPAITSSLSSAAKAERAAASSLAAQCADKARAH